MTCVTRAYQLEGFGSGTFGVVVVLLAQVSHPQRQFRVVLFERDVRQVELGASEVLRSRFGPLAADSLH